MPVPRRAPSGFPQLGKPKSLIYREDTPCWTSDGCWGSFSEATSLNQIGYGRVIFFDTGDELSVRVVCCPLLV